MSTIVDTLKVVVKADDSPVKKLSSSLGNLKVALGAAAVGAAAVAFGAMIKNAINSADAIGKMAAGMGVATERMAGLQLAFSQSGLSAENMSSAMARLNAGIANGSKALEALGISATAADGSLKSNVVILGEVADKFKSFEDGAAKSALAAEIFGRELGAKMIPLLNGGASALDEYDALAAKLGLTLSSETAAAAAEFNDTLDLMGQAGKGLVTQMAAQLLPTLNSVAGTFFDAMTEGDTMKDMADALTVVIKVLAHALIAIVVAIKAVVEAFRTLSNVMKAVMSGDFSGAFDAAKTGLANIADAYTKAGEQIKSVWKGTEDQAVRTAAALNKAARGQAPSTKSGGSVKETAAELQAKRDAAAAQKSTDERIRQLNVFLDAQRASNMTEAELTIAKHEADLAQLNEAYELKMITAGEYAELEFEAKQEHDTRMFELEAERIAKEAEINAQAVQQKEALMMSSRQRIAAFEKAKNEERVWDHQTTAERLGNLEANFLNNIAKLKGHHSKRVQGIARAAAKIQQAIAIKDALVSTYQGVAKSLSAAPFPVNLALAAGSLAAGMAQVSAIRAQGFANGGTPPTDQVSIVGERGPELFVPKSRGTVIPNEDLFSGKGNNDEQQQPPNITNINVSAVDGESVAKFFREHGKVLFATINQVGRSQPA